MAERPLLLLAKPVGPVTRRKLHGGSGNYHFPSRGRQVERLTPAFNELKSVLDRRRTRLQAESTGINPEEVLVLETVGSVESFITAVRKVPELEWLGEIETEDIPPDRDFFDVDTKGKPKTEKQLRGRLFLVFTNQQALRELLSLWNRWKRDEALDHGWKKWGSVFRQLRDIRPWGVQDRLRETGVLDDWRQRVEYNEEVVPCEIELWYRQDAAKRLAAERRVEQLINNENGKIIKRALIEEIHYHTLLVKLPVASIQVLLVQPETDLELIQCEQIQFIRATGQMAVISPDNGDSLEKDTSDPEPGEPKGTPVVALLDGLPLQRHQRLAGRLLIDDPDELETRYQANERRHGTAMASLIVHGDLSQHETPLQRPVYVRPILQPDRRDWRRPRYETVPENTLVVDLIHRAVRRILQGDDGNGGVAPTICVINLSIGILDRLFYGALSPLARLLDWLSWEYGLLFIVSAGNHTQPITLPISEDQTKPWSDEEIEKHILKEIAQETRHRRLLSPAESMNAITVGALHDDHWSGDLPSLMRDPYTSPGLPSPINAQGMGYRRSVKPEILVPGGKVALVREIGKETYRLHTGTQPPGQKTAAPGSISGDISAVGYTRGTSNATALASRAAALLADVLDELRHEPGGEILGTVDTAVWLKALLVHGADWRARWEVLSEVLRTSDNSRQLREYVTRFLGYGAPDFSRVHECTACRATALSGGRLSAEQANKHLFPLPPSLSGKRDLRRLIITLAWFTPINPMHQGWRRAELSFSPPTEKLRVERKQADHRAVQRGTVQHEILEGEDAAAFVDGDNLEIQIDCRADAGPLEGDIPYALAITLEVAESIGISIYNEIRTRIRALVEVAPHA